MDSSFTKIHEPTKHEFFIVSWAQDYVTPQIYYKSFEEARKAFDAFVDELTGNGPCKIFVGKEAERTKMRREDSSVSLYNRFTSMRNGIECDIIVREHYMIIRPIKW